MFKKQTVFILGAGASAPYGFPTAERLVRTIVEKSLQNRAYLQHTQMEIQMSSNKFRSMAEELRPSHTPSIDLWLETRKTFLEVGKIAIARELIEAEHAAVLEGTTNWYADLFHSYLRPDAVDPGAIITRL